MEKDNKFLCLTTCYTEKVKEYIPPGLIVLRWNTPPPPKIFFLPSYVQNLFMNQKLKTEFRYLFSIKCY